MRDDGATGSAKVKASAGSGAPAMSQNVPGCPNARADDNLSGAQVPAALSDVQFQAVEMLIAGTSPGKVAEACAVDRRTLYRWRYECAPFAAELERRRREVWASAADRVRAMILTSLRILNEDLQDQQWQDTRRHAALNVLRMTNVRKLVETEMAGGGE